MKQLLLSRRKAEVVQMLTQTAQEALQNILFCSSIELYFN